MSSTAHQRGGYGTSCPFFTRLAGAGTVWLYLYLRAGDGAGHRLSDHLDDAKRRGLKMENLLSIVTFCRSWPRCILALFLRGEDAAAQSNAKWTGDDRNQRHLLGVPDHLGAV